MPTAQVYLSDDEYHEVMSQAKVAGVGLGKHLRSLVQSALANGNGTPSVIRTSTEVLEVEATPPLEIVPPPEPFADLNHRHQKDRVQTGGIWRCKCGAWSTNNGINWEGGDLKKITPD